MLQSLECGVQELQEILSIGVPFVVPSVFLDFQLDLKDVRDKPSSPSVTHTFLPVKMLLLSSLSFLRSLSLRFFLLLSFSPSLSLSFSPPRSLSLLLDL